MSKYSAGMLSLLSLFFLFQGQASADVVNCTDIQSVGVSHFVTHNNEYGGHVNAHVLGQTPPAGFSQNGRTLFRDMQDWEDAYRALANQVPALQCSTAAAVGTEAARTLPRQYFSYQCTAAAADGTCTAQNEVQTNHVNYVLRVAPYGTGSRWIVFTAYPTPE